MCHAAADSKKKGGKRKEKEEARDRAKQRLGWGRRVKGTNLSGLRHLCFLIEFRVAAAAAERRISSACSPSAALAARSFASERER